MWHEVQLDEASKNVIQSEIFGSAANGAIKDEKLR